MKKIVFLAIASIFAASIFTLLSCKRENKSDLTIYVYGSLDWLRKEVIPSFEKKYNCKVEIDSSFNDTGDMISKILLEKSNPKADVVMGVTPSNIGKLKKENILKTYLSKNVKNIKKESVIFDKEGYITPFDYGAIAVLYNPEKIESLVKFEDLWKYDKKLIIQDPRTSSTGLDFLIWTVGLYGENWKTQWKNLKKGVLTATSGWNEAFAKFESGEAPMMISYATDPAYSFENYASLKYKVFIPEEGAYVQIEGAGILKGTKNFELASKFIDFTLTEDFQKEIPLNQWMFPVTGVKLPDSFEYAVNPEKIVETPSEIYSNINDYISEWETLFSE